ncbi:hypothetical protein [Amaricoccus sp.]|uniref:hypothetical protein n=1 Tax=Amaricoccus sp. TaxID=1872485 RepID=UPI001B62A930|nr:hypothetical protein [Amaricoccus sp.]MBP7001728.1 hypothetical protein [Amaricoccus sp.]
MEKFKTYFGSYLSGIASVVALIPLVLTNFSVFPLLPGNFSSIFGFMCTVLNFLIIGLVVFFIDSLKKYLSPAAPLSKGEAKISRLLQLIPVALTIIFIVSCFYYIAVNERIIRDIFIADMFVFSSANMLCVAALTIMFVGPIVALTLMGAKDAIERERSDGETGGPSAS